MFSGKTEAQICPTKTHDKLVIETKDLGKSCGKVAALKSLNLKVPCNSIFGFSGARAHAFAKDQKTEIREPLISL